MESPSRPLMFCFFVLLFSSTVVNAFERNFDSMHIAGSQNGWSVSATPMENTSDFLWQADVEFDAGARFKFVPVSWSDGSFGDTDGNGVADSSGGGNINLDGDAGLYRVKFNDQTLAYSIVATSGNDEYKSNEPSMNLVGNFNNWSLTSAPMELIDNNIWQINIEFPPSTNFKFVPVNWSKSYGDVDLDGEADSSGGGNIPYSGGSALVSVQFNDETLRYTVVSSLEPQPPVADAGEDQYVKLGAVASLSGVGSSDLDGDIVSYEWSRGFADGATTSRQQNELGEFEVVLTVTDDDGLTASDSVMVSVYPNRKPDADAGKDITVMVGDIVSLDAGQSSDIDGDELQYDWSHGSEGVRTTISYDVIGVYEVVLTVTDTDGASDTDSISITVTDRALQANYDSMNLVGSHNNWSLSSTPMVLESDNTWVKTIEFASDDRFKFVPIDWSESFGDVDKDGTADNFGGGNIEVTAGAGVYKIVFNDETRKYEMLKDTAPQPPTAVAGEDIQIKVGSAAELDASSSSDADGQIISYEWSGGFESLVRPSKVMGEIGEYTITLTVTDDQGLSDTDTVIVSVVDNVAPVATIEGDLVASVDDIIIFDGSSSYDPDGDELSFAWDNGDLTSKTTRSFSQVGIYTVSLAVSDSDGATTSKSVQLVVKGRVYTSNYPAMYIVGDNNGWKLRESLMDLVGDHQWEFIYFQNLRRPRFKFVPDDWSLSFGDANADGIADSTGGGNIEAPFIDGDYKVRFNDETLEYTIEEITDGSSIRADFIFRSPLSKNSKSHHKLGEEIVVDGSGSAYASEFSWDLDDDGTVDTNWNSLATFRHSFSTLGNNSVTLHVRNDEGFQSSRTKTINVVDQTFSSTKVFVEKSLSDSQALGLRGGYPKNFVSDGKYESALIDIIYPNTFHNSELKLQDKHLDWSSSSPTSWVTYTHTYEKEYELDGWGYDDDARSVSWLFHADMAGEVGEWFEFKAVVNDNGKLIWESARSQEGTPADSNNHWGRIGCLNFTKYNSNEMTIRCPIVPCISEITQLSSSQDNLPPNTFYKYLHPEDIVRVDTSCTKLPAKPNWVDSYGLEIDLDRDGDDEASKDTSLNNPGIDIRLKEVGLFDAKISFDPQSYTFDVSLDQEFNVIEPPVREEDEYWLSAKSGKHVVREPVVYSVSWPSKYSGRKYRWDFNNDGKFDTDWEIPNDLNDYQISYTPQTTGRHYVGLEVQDVYGNRNNWVLRGEEIYGTGKLVAKVANKNGDEVSFGYPGNLIEVDLTGSTGITDARVAWGEHGADEELVFTAWRSLFDFGHKYSEVPDPKYYQIVVQGRDTDGYIHQKYLVYRVDPLSVAKFEIEGLQDDGTLSYFQGLSLNASSSENAHGYRWKIGDGEFTYVFNDPEYFVNLERESGEYSLPITLDISGWGDLQTITKTITVIDPRPSISQTISPNTIEPNQVVYFDASGSSHAHEFMWDFGDGSTTGWLDSPKVSHAYKESNYFASTLYVRNRYGYEKSFRQTVVVGAKLDANFTADVTEVERTNEQTLYRITADASVSTGASRFKWKFDGEDWSEFSSDTILTRDVWVSNFISEYETRQIVLFATPESGFSESVDSRTIKLGEVGQKPINAYASINSYRSEFSTMEAVPFDSSGTRNAELYCWDWDSDSECDTEWTTNTLVTKVFDEPGRKEITLHAANQDMSYVEKDTVAINISAVADKHYPKPAYTPLNSASAPVGNIDGSFSVTPQGASTYTIPIAVPPGRGGMHPDLSIQYSSTGSDISLLGAGWTISGVSSISRCRKALDQGEVSKAILWDKSDTFCLGGSRLVSIKGEYGGDQTEYRTEKDAFARITSHHAPGIDGPAYFMAETKDGRIQYFGATDDSRRLLDYKNTVMHWQISEVRDRSPDGNPITFHYERGKDEIRISEIQYTKSTNTGSATRKVVFNYESQTRPDAREFWNSRQRSSISKRLHSIHTEVYGEKIYEYVFDYKNPDDFYPGMSEKSLLTSIEQCAFDGLSPVCLPPNTFEYEKSELKFSDTKALPNSPKESEILRTYILDINGDGRQDIVQYDFVKDDAVCLEQSKSYNKFSGKYTYTCEKYAEDDQHIWMVRFGGLDGFSEKLQMISSSQIGVSKTDAKYALPIDYNADGRQDLLIPGKNGWGVIYFDQPSSDSYECNGSCFSYKSDIGFDHKIGYKSRPRVGDVNGDGLPDIVWRNSGSDDIWVRFNSGSGFHGADVKVSEIRAFYNNNGGYHYEPNNPDDTRPVGQHSVFPNNSMEKDGRDEIASEIFKSLQLIDLDGNGRADFVYMMPVVTNGSHPKQGAWSRAVSYGMAAVEWDGKKFTHRILENSWSGYTWDFESMGRTVNSYHEYNPLTLYGDYNADGLTDAMIAYEHLEVDWKLFINTGGEFQEPIDVGIPVPRKNDDFKRASVSDVNSDGISDIVLPTGKTIKYLVSNIENNDFTIVDTKLPYYGENNLVAFRLADFNGDGLLDVMRGKNEELRFAYNAGSKPYMLTKIDSGTGVVTEVNYGSLLNPDLYDVFPKYLDNGEVKAECAFPQSCLNIGMTVVASHTATSGKDNFASYRYRYGDLRADAHGHGILGFGKFETIDENPFGASLDPKFAGAQREKRSVTVFHNSGYDPTTKTYPLAGLMKESFSFINGELHAHSTADFGVLYTHKTNQTPYSVNQLKSVQTEYELDNQVTEGDAIGSTTINYQYDIFGNTTCVDATSIDGVRTVSKNNYFETEQVEQHDNTVGMGCPENAINSIPENVLAADSSWADKWIIGRLKLSIVNEDRPAGLFSNIDQSWQTRTSAFTYDAGTGFRKLEIVEPNATDERIKLTKETTYDFEKSSGLAYGNIVEETNIGQFNSSGVERRSIKTHYDLNRFDAVFPYALENSLGHQSYFDEYNLKFGLPTKQIDANGLVAYSDYDNFGREIRKTLPNGASVSTTYHWRSPADLSEGFIVEVEDSVNGLTQTHYDLLSRKTKTVSRAYHQSRERYVAIDFDFDTLGNQYRSTQPYFVDRFLGEFGTPVGSITWLNTYHDTYGRTSKTEAPFVEGQGIVETSYDYSTIEVSGRKLRAVRMVDAEGRSRTEYSSLGGELLQVKDEGGELTQYDYDVSGELSWVKAPGVDGKVTRIGYDLRGHKISMSDNTMGDWSYEYSSEGALLSQTDSNGSSTTITYDSLGRIKTRTASVSSGKNISPEQKTTWHYDEGFMALGNISKVVKENAEGKESYSESYIYDNFGRVVSKRYSIEGQSYIVNQTYNDDGLVATTEYPSNGLSTVVTENFYDQYGFLYEIKNKSNGRSLLKVNEVSPFGEPSLVTASLGVTVRRDFDLVTGYLKSIRSNNGTVQHLDYGYYKDGSLKSRTSRRGNDQLEEVFEYDAYNRLGVVRQSLSNGMDLSETYSYDIRGNIKQFNSSSLYEYQPERQYVIKSIGSRKFQHDAIGNNTSDYTNVNINRKSLYNTYNKPRSITSASLTKATQWRDGELIELPRRKVVSAEFLYDADRQRVLKRSQTATYESCDTESCDLISSNQLETTTYIGGIYEKVLKGKFATHRYYVSGANITILIERKMNGSRFDSEKTYTLLPDHLGSIDTIYSASNSIEYQSFSAFGQRRDLFNLTKPAPDVLAQLRGTTKMGFTGHEMDDDIGLINMKGRLYDPSIGRFTSADPNVQAPTNPQNLNRYAYVLNNPLSYTDPTGFYFEPKDRSSIQMAAAAVAIVVAVVFQQYDLAGYLAETFLISEAASIVAAGALTGAAAGAASAYVASGGDLRATMRGGVMGALSGMMFGGAHNIGPEASFFSSNWHIALARFTVHGVIGGMMSVANGGKFEHGFISAAAQQAANGLGLYKTLNISDSDIISNAVVAAVVGGTAADLNGGKFANGAVTAVFARLLNDTSGRRNVGSARLSRGISEPGNMNTAHTRSATKHSRSEVNRMVPKGKNLTVNEATSRKGDLKRDLLFGDRADAMNWAKDKLGHNTTKTYNAKGQWNGWQNSNGDKVYWNHGDWGKGKGSSNFPHLNYSVGGTSGHLFLGSKIVNKGMWESFKMYFRL